jgi:hypothetical protein
MSVVVTAIIDGKTVQKTVESVLELKQLLNSVDDFGDNKIIGIEGKL